MPADTAYFPLSEVADVSRWPIAGLIPEGLDHLWLTGPEYDSATRTGHINFQIENELALRVPGLDFATFALGSTAGSIDFTLTVSFEPFRIGVRLPVTLRIDAKVLRPIEGGAGNQPDLDAETLDIALGTIDLSIDGEGHLDLGVSAAVQVPRCMIGDSGVIIEGKLRWLTPVTAQLPPNTPADFTGVYLDDVIVEIPQLPTALSAIEMNDVFIGTGGFSGEIRRPGLALQWSGTDFTGDMHGELFGFKGGITSMSIKFRQNALVACVIKGDVFVPYLNKRVGLTLGLDGAGGVTATAALPTSLPSETGVSAGSPGYLIHLELGNILSIDVASLMFQVPVGSLPRLGISGRVAPGTGVLNFPPIEMAGLWIDTRGRIQTEGDGIRLPSRYTLNFHGFLIEILKLGFGNTEDGGKWIGFTGGVKLLSGMPAGASVEGLRITWYEDGRSIQTTLNGVGVNFEVPNAIKFSGAVSYRSDQQQFRGAIKLNLIALKMQIDATAVFGIREGQLYLAVYLAAEFPAGIPLFATGLGVYGMAGLFALNMEPKRAAGQEWYALGSTTDWYHSLPAVGVTSLDKWTPRTGSMAFGAGVTLGTVADNGHTFSGRVLLAILFPGPILLIQGSASILQERATLDRDANFRAIGVLDGRAGTLLIGLDAQYRYDNNGALIDIRGAAEAFFNFNDPTAWRLNVGLKEPRERRLAARLFQLFDSYAYVMLNAQQLAMGAWIGFKQQWQFGPLSVAVEAWIDGNARVSWKPAHFYGDLRLHGSARLSVFGFTVGLTVDAGIRADVFNPFHVVGQFSVAIDLPWPLSDISVNIKLEWGPNPTPPPLPLPLKEVAIEHFKATTSWPLARGSSRPLLLPNYNSNGDGFFQSPIGGSVPVNLNDVPAVPMDCRPHLTFARNINDDALIGVNAQAVVPEWERIGDPVRNQGPARIRYGLEEIVLEKKFSDGVWRPVARKGRTANSPGLPTLYGSWAPVPQMPGGGGRNVGQVKLWLWSKNPLEYTRYTSRAWEQWFADRFSGYPCQSQPVTCWDFENIAPVPKLREPWSHPDEPELSISSSSGIGLSIVVLRQPVHGLTHAFSIALPNRVDIHLPRPTSLVRIMISDDRLFRTSDFVGIGADGERYGATIDEGPDRPCVEMSGTDIVRVEYFCEALLPVTLARGVGAAIGGDYIPSRHQLIFVEFHGKLSAIDLATNQYKVLGTGYTNPEDVTVNASGTVAYVTERSGTLLRVDLTAERADRSDATVVSSGMTAPQQIALDEAQGKAYVVEYGGAGRLLRIDLNGLGSGKQTVLASGLDQAVGLLINRDATAAYVSEQGGGGRLTQITLASGARETIAGNLPAIFFLRWAGATRTSILAVQRDPINSVVQIALGKLPAGTQVVMDHLPFRPSSVVVLPDDRHAVCSDQELTVYALMLQISSICDGDAHMLVRHFEEELVRWSQAGEVLEPYTQYRLKIETIIKARGEGELAGYSAEKKATEFAYFRTDGPPGVAKLTPPPGSDAIATFASPLDDLTRYVRRTMPAVAASTPERPVQERFFYRAYDIGIEFDENYVDLMYRFGRRDLSIQIHDGNGAIRDDEGRRLVLANQWGEAEKVTLTDREERWLAVLGSSGCTLVERGAIVKNTTFNAPSEAHVLPASALCEARLVPALLHDSFGGYAANAGANGPNGSFERWQVRDDSGSVASRWQINSEATSDFVLAQTTTATTTLVYKNAIDLPQDHPEQPANWTAYRLTAHLRFNDGRIGLVWRYLNAAQHYRFVMDSQAGKRELILISGGVATVLATKPFTHIPGQRYVISVEADGPSSRVYQDGVLVFAVTDSAVSAGTIGVHCAGTASGRFTDVYVDDFRSAAPVVYRFSFLTSRFTNFVNHLGSFENKTWLAELSPAANVAPLISAAVPSSSLPSDAESRAYDALLAQLPAASAPTVVRATRVQQSGSSIAFLIQTPEPLEWRRIALQVLRAPLNTGMYVPITALVLRRPDGAGLFIVSPASNSAGSLLPQAEYRLIFTYRRNNHAVDPDSDLLSEAGNSAPEEATLNLRW